MKVPDICEIRFQTWKKSVEYVLPLYLITGVVRQVHSELIRKDVYIGG